MTRKRGEAPTYHCRQCRLRKPAQAFRWQVTSDDKPVPRKICCLCLGDEGHKPCRSCQADKPIEEFYWVKSSYSDTTRPMPDCKDCWRAYKNERKRGGAPKKRPGPKKGLMVGRHGSRRPIGWTPPPSAEELARIHRSASPPPGWTPLDWEDCA